MTNILVIEDDRLLCTAYQLKLTRSGFNVKVATDGSEALEQLISFMPDAILLDLVMPRMDGYTFLAKLRANPAWRQIPVLVTSNLNQPVDMQRAKLAGANRYILKSNVSIDEVVAEIYRCLGQTPPTLGGQ